MTTPAQPADGVDDALTRAREAIVAAMRDAYGAGAGRNKTCYTERSRRVLDFVAARVREYDARTLAASRGDTPDARVRELVEADREYDAAHDAADYLRMKAATERRAAALAAMDQETKA